MTLAKETQDFLLSKFISNIEETADDWFVNEYDKITGKYLFCSHFEENKQ